MLVGGAPRWNRGRRTADRDDGFTLVPRLMKKREIKGVRYYEKPDGINRPLSGTSSVKESSLFFLERSLIHDSDP
jgi:hypothetical protein